jgi:hypothetical protein
MCESTAPFGHGSARKEGEHLTRKVGTRKHGFEREGGVAASPAICETAGVPGICTPVAALPPSSAALAATSVNPPKGPAYDTVR